MRWFFSKISTLLVVYYAQMLEYRAEILFWILSGSLPIILMGVWIQAANSGNFNLSSIEFARYFFAVFIVRQFTNIWVIWEFEKEVLQGILSFKLLQPLDPVWHYVGRHLAEKVTRFPLIIILTVLFFNLYPQAFWIPSFGQIFLGILGIMLSFSLYFLIQYTFAMFAFWTERASAIQDLWFLFYIFLSGMIAPLETFPPGVKEWVLLTPFPYGVYFPAAMLVGLPVNLGKSLLVVVGWLLIVFLINRWLWHKGLKQYSGMGA
ncbi:MAG: ABC-2 family transporter protein [Snowella sp.]|nr:ABC-2 family transporter protein [Snowella sp.]